MTRRLPPSADDAADAAIVRVLAVEREARDVVARATSDAGALVEAARTTAHAIAESTEQRMRRVREAFAGRAAQEIAAIDAEVRAQDAVRALSSDDLARLERAVAALCVELTTASP
ncbi:MAG: hypothetical protein ABI569_16375 [Casimicrobiaceae bacterium]